MLVLQHMLQKHPRSGFALLPTVCRTRHTLRMPLSVSHALSVCFQGESGPPGDQGREGPLGPPGDQVRLWISLLDPLWECMGEQGGCRLGLTGATASWGKVLAPSRTGSKASAEGPESLKRTQDMNRARKWRLGC